MLNLHFKKLEFESGMYMFIESSWIHPICFLFLWSFTQKADVGVMFYNIPKAAVFPSANSQALWDLTECCFSLAEGLHAECFHFQPKEIFFLWEVSRNDSMISIWCGVLGHAQTPCQLNAFVLWGFQLNVLLACPWPGSLMHGGGWSLLLLAWGACTMSSPSCLTWDHSIWGQWTWVEQGRKRKIGWGQEQCSKNPPKRNKMSFLCSSGPQMYVSKISIKDAQVLVTPQAFSQRQEKQHMQWQISVPRRLHRGGDREWSLAGKWVCTGLVAKDAVI